MPAEVPLLEPGTEPGYVPARWGLVRAPALPIEDYQEFCRLDRVADPDAVRAFYRRALDDPRVRSALAAASPSLDDALERSLDLDLDSTIARSLHRYLMRMCARPTPFGLFAGVCLTTWAETTTLQLVGPPTTRTRPDMQWLFELVFAVESDARVRQELCYVISSAVFERAERLIVATPSAGIGPTDELTQSVRATAVTRFVASSARVPIYHRDLVERICQQFAATPDRAEQLIDQLWSHQLLQTDLRPPLTLPDPARYVLDKLAGIPAASAAAAGLEELLGAMRAWDAAEHPDPVAFRQLGRLARQVGSESRATQVDLVLTVGEPVVSHRVATEAARAAELLLRLTPSPYGVPALQAFAERFLARFGAEHRVPLLELLDPEFGLGSPYTAELDSPSPPRRARDQVLMDLAAAALRDRLTAIELDAPTMAALSEDQSGAALPDSLDIAVLVAARHPDDIDAGHFTVVVGPNLGGDAAGRNAARFADLLGPDASSAFATSSGTPTQPASVIEAELVYVPSLLRAANITVRPHGHDYEVVLGCSAGVPASHTVHLSELSVRLQDGTFVVSWDAHGVDLLIRANHMLNARSSPAVCRFLTDLSQQRQVPFRPFDWGPAALLPALPRIQVGRIVLALARWRPTELVEVARQATTADFAAAVTDWRDKWTVPRYVYLSFVDQRLLLDLECQLQLNAFRSELRRGPDQRSIVVDEAVPGPGDAWLSGPEGHFASEIVVPLVRRDIHSAAPRSASIAESRLPAVRKSIVYPPGTDWLYAKLYCPAYSEDDVLLDAASFGQMLLAAGSIDNWFFVRYADPDRHLRVRMHGRRSTLQSVVSPQLSSWARHLVERDVCQRFGLDTYEPEVERYGGVAGVELSERIFGADSRAVAELLDLVRSGRSTTETVALAAWTTSDLLRSLGCDLASQLDLLHPMVQPPVPSAADRQLVRTARVLLFATASDSNAEPQAAAVLRARHLALAEPVAALGVLREDPQFPHDRFLRSHAHMHANRLGLDRRAEAQMLRVLVKTLYGLSVAPARDTS